MGKIRVLLLLLSLLLALPLAAQEVFIRGDNQAATQARMELEKLTRYKSSLDTPHAVLVVERESWSPDFLSPATVAVTMKLISMRGGLLWSRTEPLGSRSEELALRDLLEVLAKAEPRLL